MNPFRFCSIRILFLFFTLGLAGCPFSSGDEPAEPDEPTDPVSTTFTVGGTLTGLDNPQVTLTFLVLHSAGNPDIEDLTVGADGLFTFATPLIDGQEWKLFITSALNNPEQECIAAPESGTIAGASVDNVSVTCHDGYYVSVSVNGLENVPKSDAEALNLRNDSPRQPAPGDLLPVFNDGNHRFLQKLISGEAYDVRIEQHPRNPNQQCEIENGSGITGAADVNDIRIRCGNATVGGTVTGLIGSGLQATLLREVEVNGTVSMLVIERLPIEEDGEFEFETLLVTDEPYEVGIWSHPVDPDQFCIVGNNEGTITGDVTDVEIKCPGPLRKYRYDDNYTKTGKDEDDGTMAGVVALHSGKSNLGIVHHEFLFESEPSIPLGAVSMLGETPLFQKYIDRPGGDGVVHSNASGKTYWIIAESPLGTFEQSANGYPLYQQQTKLQTIWRFRKSSASASFRLEISQANMLAYDDVHPQNSCCSMVARAEISVHAHRILDFGEGSEPEVTLDPVPFYDMGGAMDLVGSIDPGDPNGTLTVWQKDLFVRNDVSNVVWSDSDFTLDSTAGNPALVQPRQVAYLTLDESVFVDVDMSDIGVGEEIAIVSDAIAWTHNLYSVEGGTAVFFRDPAEADPGENEDDETGGVRVVAIEGLEMLSIGDLAEGDIRSGGGGVPGVCDPSVTEPAVLEFSATEFTVSETPEIPQLKGIRVLRSGNFEGLVTARISKAGITADAVEDFAPGLIDVRFGDGSDAPRTLEPFVVDDDIEESAETLTLSLHSPEGCATIGTNDTATVTILASDPSPGTVAFASDAYDVDESAGVASIAVERVGGISGIIAVNVATSDGTGIAGIDYGAVMTQVVFQDGDATSRTVQVPIIDNTVNDGDRMVLLAMSSLNPATVGTPANAVLTIIDNDFPDHGTLQFGAANYLVNEDSGSVTASVTRTGGSADAVGVTVATSDGAATSPADFAALQTVVSFAAGDTATKTVDIIIVDDSEDEGDHAFILMLFDPTGGAELGTPAIASVVIVDNDGAPPAPPGAAVLNVTAEPKQLVFDWATVNDASFYRIMMDPTGIAGFTQVGNDLPLGETMFYLPVAAHLVDWTNARFMLQACNSNGCTNSNIVSAEALMLAAIGYFKASNTDGRQQVVPFDGDLFGWALALSDDGRTLAVTGYNEDSNAVFVNGNQSDNSQRDSGAVYVFTESTTGWAQQAYLKASNTDTLDHFGAALAISADGNTLAVAAPNEASNSAGINGDQSNNAMNASGAVYVYTRSADVWSLQAYLKASNTDAADLFGTALAISGDGNTLIVGAPDESSGATGLNGNQADNGAPDAGAVYVFTRVGSSWSQSDYVKASNTEADDGFGTDVAISGDGATIAIAAIYEDSAATGINGDQSDNSAPGNGSFLTGTGAVYVFSNASGAWVQEAYVKSSNLDADDRFGSSLVLSQDGTLLVVGAELEDSVATGVNSPLESDDSKENAGAAYVFARSGAFWQQAAYMKASNPDRDHRFGRAVDLSDDGRFVIVGADGEDSKSVGINGDQRQSLNVDIGATYLFERNLVSGDWSQRAYVKASNADQDSFGFGRELSFGFAVAISGDGAALAVSGHRDNSNATGINGDQVNEEARQSGAVYIY